MDIWIHLFGKTIKIQQNKTYIYKIHYILFIFIKLKKNG